MKMRHTVLCCFVFLSGCGETYLIAKATQFCKPHSGLRSLQGFYLPNTFLKTQYELVCADGFKVENFEP